MTEIILGPPGSGKTTTLLNMVEKELESGVPPENIGYVTFTKRGAQEAVERACARFGLPRNRLRFFRTLHSLCFWASGLGSGDILEGKKIVEFGDWLGIGLSESISMEEGTVFGYQPGDRAMFMENLARTRCISLRQQYDEYCDDLPWYLVERVERGLREFKRDRHLADYTDMLQMFVDGDVCPKLDRLFVDEAQDLTALQWRVVWKIARNASRVVIAGDDDQAIYAWAGADVNYFVDMPGKATVLAQSWRVPERVQKLGEGIIQRVSHRRPKAWRARVDDSGTAVQGNVVRAQSFYEVDDAGDDVLVLGRNAQILRPITEELRRRGVIYEWHGKSSISNQLINAVTCWERLRLGQKISVDEARLVYNFMDVGKAIKRGHKTIPGYSGGDSVDMSWMQTNGGLMTTNVWHESMTRIPDDDRVYMLRARQRGEKLLDKPRIRVSTMHAIKGGQADRVIIMRDMASRTYNEMFRNPDDEARVWYVAATRTKTELTIVAPKTGKNYDV